MLERREACAQNACLVEDLQRALVAGDVQLISRGSFKRPPAVRADLGGDAKRTQQAERAARNRFGIVVPCHRVVAADGLGAYGSLGSEYKQRLLALEGVAV